MSRHSQFRRMGAVACAVLMITATALPAAAETRSETELANAPILVDAMILRPAGLISLVLGTALFVGITPIVLVTRPHEIHKPFKLLVIRPAKYTWGDPLGGH